MSEYVDKAKIYKQLSELEDRERTVFLGMAWDNPMKARAVDKLTIYTELKHRLADMPAENVMPVKECIHLLEDLDLQVTKKWEWHRNNKFHGRPWKEGFEKAILSVRSMIHSKKVYLRGDYKDE